MGIGSPPLLFGPIAPENNPPINPQYYQPRVYNISAIANGTTTLVTTTINHDYVVGQEVRFVISQLYGERQLNQQTGLVISVPAANQVIVNIDSTNYDAFVANLNSRSTQPQIVAVGDVNSGVTNTSGRTNNGTFIPGSFIDISPL
jgi:hypothetical protein